MKTERNAARAGARDAMRIVEDEQERHAEEAHAGELEPLTCGRCRELEARADAIVDEWAGLP